MAIYKLGEIAKIVSGKGPKIEKGLEKYEDKNGTINWLLVKNFKNNNLDGKFIKYNLDPIIHKLVKLNKNEIAYSMYATPGLVAINQDYDNLYINQSFCKILPSKLVLHKYLFYYLISKRKQFLQLASGTTQNNLNISKVKNLTISIPSLETQSAILNIIEPKEDLFLRYKNLVRIDNEENTKKDLRILINIIEPLEKLFFNVKNLKIILEKFVSKTYKHSKKRKVNMLKASKISFFNYRNQKLYCPTSLVGKLSLSINKVENISFHNRPSRANLSPLNNSILFSKLVGENKILPISKEEEIVFSTGFFNIQDKNNLNDNLISFLLSEDFVEQKNKYKQGTTMESINVKNLKMFDIKENVFKGNNIFLLFATLIKLENKLDFLIHKKIINLLI